MNGRRHVGKQLHAHMSIFSCETIEKFHILPVLSNVAANLHNRVF